MALSIRNPETDHLVRELAEATGEDLTDAVTTAVRERLQRVQRKHRGIADALMRLASVAPPVRDARPLHELVTDEDWGLSAS